jgi:predicted DNA-binding transcriptional regulator AlpA
MVDDLLNQRLAAARLGLPSARTLEAWRRRGYGPPFLRLSSRLVRYRVSDIDRWLGARVVGAHRRENPDPSAPGDRRSGVRIDDRRRSGRRRSAR